MTASPYNLLKGYGIHIKVMAHNAYGSSQLSQAGNGGVIVLVPDAPLNLQNDKSTTSKSVIRFTWSDGSSDGGTAIIDYRISYDQSTNNYVVLATGVTSRSYTTDVTLISGRTYFFKVEARNSVGYSLLSSAAGIQAAQVPGQPSVPTTTIQDSDVLIKWSIPEDGSA